MESHYEINVSKNGRHFFATAPRSCVSPGDATEVVREIYKKFPESEGYKVTMMNISCSGTPVDLSKTV